MKLSVIVPVWNEAAMIGRCLAALSEQRGFAERIVVDGGSSDRTVEIARSYAGVQVIEAPRGRGPQQNAGARQATGDVLVFVHADAGLPPDAAAAIVRTLSAPDVVAGAFRTRHVRERSNSLAMRAAMRVADLRSRYTRLPYGDQALFVSARGFADAGGYPDIPLMEDLVLARRLRRLGRICIAPERVTVSGRRLEAAPIRSTLYWNIFPLLHTMGVSPAVLARLYGHAR